MPRLTDSVQPSAIGAALECVVTPAPTAAFEVALARAVERGEEETAWFTRHGSVPITGIPADWPLQYRELVRRRLGMAGGHAFCRILRNRSTSGGGPQSRGRSGGSAVLSCDNGSYWRGPASGAEA